MTLYFIEYPQIPLSDTQNIPIEGDEVMKLNDTY